MAERIRWGPGREAAFIEYLDTELRDAQGARVGIERAWRGWLDV